MSELRSVNTPAAAAKLRAKTKKRIRPEYIHPGGVSPQLHRDVSTKSSHKSYGRLSIISTNKTVVIIATFLFLFLSHLHDKTSERYLKIFLMH